MSKVKSQKPNKSAAIREFRKANPAAAPREIAAALAKAENGGLKVSAQFVSTVLSNAKKGKGTGKRGPKVRPLKVSKSQFTDAVKAIRLLDDLRATAARLGVTVADLLMATE